MKREELWLIGGLALAAYLILRKPFVIAGEAAQAVVNFGGKVGSVVYDIVNPAPAGEMLFYTVNFPDGSRHAIPSGIVSTGGFFEYAGNRYRLGMMDGKRIAVPA